MSGVEAGRVARSVWRAAVGAGDGPLVWELGPCDCGEGHSCHIVREHRPASVGYIAATVGDLVPVAGCGALAVWSETGDPDRFGLVVVSPDQDVALIGSRSSVPQLRLVRTGGLVRAMRAALAPVSFEDKWNKALVGLTTGE